MNVVTAAFQRPLVYIGVSYGIFTLFVIDYFSTYQELFPTLVRMTNSSLFKVLFVNAVVATFLLAWTVVRLVFFGSLNGPERDAIQGAMAIYFVECVVSPLYMGESAMSTFTLYLIGLMLLRTLHKLAEERVTTLAITDDAHARRWKAIRLAAFLVCVVLLDSHLCRTLWSQSVLLFDVVKRDPDVEDVAAHAGLMITYCGLILVGQCGLSAVRTMVRLHRTLTHYGEDGHTAMTFYAANLTNMAESCAAIAAIIAVWIVVGPPFFLFRFALVHLMRCDESVRNLVRYIMLARRMHHFDNVELADLQRETRCTICYDEMTAGPLCKRLPCGHCYHDHCLRGWFESHATCPYCRANVWNQRGGPAAAPAPEAPEAAAGAVPVDAAAPAAPGTQDHHHPQYHAASHVVPAATAAADELPDAEVVAAYNEYMASLETAGSRFVEAVGQRRGTEATAAREANKQVSPVAAHHGEVKASAPAPAPVLPAKVTQSPAVTAIASTEVPSAPPSRPQANVVSPPTGDAAHSRTAGHPLLSKLAAQREAPATVAAPAATAPTARSSPEARQAARLEAYRRYEQQVVEAQRTLQRSLAALDAEESGSA